jgi:ABC-type Zn uptake system ZnuABC Zn-binding protein ZnuA
MRTILICLSLLPVLSAGCGDTSGGSSVDVIATTAIAADITAHVAGEDADVDALLSGSASPHDYGASAKDRATLEEADLVVAWGGGLEGSLPLGELDPEPLELAAGESNPHVWMDPMRVAAALPKLAAALAEADPEHGAGYRRRADAYAEELRALDRDLRRTLGAIPDARRKLVTSHDSLGHFARRYGFEFVGSPQGLSPDSEPSASEVSGLIERVEEEDVRAVFAEDSEDPGPIEEVAREAGVPVVRDLLIESFGGEVDGYGEMLRHDAARIARALAP